MTWKIFFRAVMDAHAADRYFRMIFDERLDSALKVGFEVFKSTPFDRFLGSSRFSLGPKFVYQKVVLGEDDKHGDLAGFHEFTGKKLLVDELNGARRIAGNKIPDAMDLICELRGLLRLDKIFGLLENALAAGLKAPGIVEEKSVVLS